MGHSLWLNVKIGFNLFSSVEDQAKHSEDSVVIGRYGVNNVGSGIISPIVYTEKFININVEYNAGYFLVIEPGYYRLTAQCYYNLTQGGSLECY